MNRPVLLSLLVAAPLLGACSQPTQAEWMQSFGYDWDLFNHRVSYISMHLGEDEVVAGIVGGTSTTGVSEALDEGCDEDTCDEFPFMDDAHVRVVVSRLTERGVAVGTGTASLAAGAAGATTTVEIPLDRKGKGEPIAVIRGLTIDTDHPLTGGDACYRPRYGWHARRMAIELGEPVLAEDGKSASVDVTVAFEAGNSLEDERQCVDAVVGEAEVAFDVDVQVLVTKAEQVALPVSHAMTYTYGDGPYDPDPQPEPDLSERAIELGFEQAAAGWSAVDFTFHVDDPDARGAYLRTWHADIDLDAPYASGHATNYSPPTQLSGIDYAFTGVVRAFETDGELEQFLVEDTLDVELDESGRPVVFSIPL